MPAACAGPAERWSGASGRWRDDAQRCWMKVSWRQLLCWFEACLDGWAYCCLRYLEQPASAEMYLPGFEGNWTQIVARPPPTQAERQGSRRELRL